MKCTFYRPQEVNVSEFSVIVEKLREDLQKLEAGAVEKQEVFAYVKELCNHAKPLEHDPGMFFWGLANPNSMPHDARVDFFYLPTYLATAFLIKSALLYPELIDESEGNVSVNDIDPSDLKNILRMAMNGCTGRNFDGAGVLTLKECIEIFTSAGAVEFLEKHPELCPKFKKLFVQKKAMVDRDERPEREVWFG